MGETSIILVNLLTYRLLVENLSMIYHIYSAAVFNNSTKKAIWHYTIYKNFKFKVHSDCRQISNSTRDESEVIPVCSAISFILNNCIVQHSDLISVMTNSPTIFYMINREERLEQCPTFQKHWNTSFKNYQRLIGAHQIDPLRDYKGFRRDPIDLYEKEKNYLKKYQILLN